ncbi:MAG: hypothetical protein RLZZ136_244, partial [Pseudomonadota bacterium]
KSKAEKAKASKDTSHKASRSSRTKVRDSGKAKANRHQRSARVSSAHVTGPKLIPAPIATEAAPNPAAPVVSPPPVTIPMIGAGSEWDEARARIKASAASPIAQAIQQWKWLSSTDGASFATYTSFLLSYPGFPLEDKMRRSAEKALERENPGPIQTAVFFDRFPPLTNPGLARYALALAALRRPEAQDTALAAWRGGAMGELSEVALEQWLAGKLSTADQDARMDALLWAGSIGPAKRQLDLVSPAQRPIMAARLAALSSTDANDPVIVSPEQASHDAGWLYNRARQLRRLGMSQAASALLANRAPLKQPPLDAEKWIDLQLDSARDSDMHTAIQIAARIDDAFLPGTDVSRLSYGLRDNYTTLMWLAAMGALTQEGDPRAAAPLFRRYGLAARTAQTRAKGFYWAGRALAQAGEREAANRDFAAAGAYADQFYGMLARERLGQPLPAFDAMPTALSSPAARAAFNAQPLTAAVREVARESDWSTAVRFFREIADQAESQDDHILVADLARELGRRDLGVILGQAAHADGLGDFQKISFPLIPVPQGSNWTMVHAISRQESQFAMNAVSHVGARGLMQLMPGTARGTAAKVGLSYDPQSLLSSAPYNLRLGDAVISQNLRSYGGSYPLAIAAYNAGGGSVNKWLRANGDPRTGAIDWITWIERIPFSETRGYVQHVLENAVVYERMNPDHASYAGPNPLSHFLGKSNPG